MPHFGLLHNLPLDLLRHVLQFLPLLDLASFDQSLNHKYRPCYLAAIDGLELFDINFYLTSDLIHWLISRGVLIKSIPGSTDDANLLELIDYSRNTLKSINLSHSRLSDEIMISSLAICPNLTSINFRACIRLTDHGLQVLLDCRRNIQQLNLSRCCLITRESTKILAEYGSELQDLNLSCLQWLGDEEVKALLEGCPHLQNINLSSTQITINSVIAIIQKYPNLKSLILTGCSRVSSDANKILLRSIYHRQIISEDPSDILLGVIQLNTAFSSDPRLISEMISLDLLPRLVSLLSQDRSVEIQIEICDIFAIFPSLSSVRCFKSGTELLVVSGAMSALLNLLNSRNAEVVRHLCWVGNQWAAWPRDPHSSLLISPALHVFQNHPHRADLYLSLLSNIFRSKHRISLDDLFAILQTIAAILHSPDTSVYVSACRILKCLPSDPSLAHKIIEMNLIPHLLSYLKSSQHPDDQLVREVFEFLEKMMLPGKLDLTPPLSSDIFAINLSLLDIKEPAHSSTCSRFLFSLLHRYPSVAFNAIIFGGFISKLVTHMDKDTVHLLIEICKQGSVYEKTSLVNEGVLRYFVQAASRMPDEEVVRILDAILVLLRTAPISPSVLSCDTVLKLHQSLSSRAPSQKFSRMIQTILSELN